MSVLNVMSSTLSPPTINSIQVYQGEDLRGNGGSPSVMVKPGLLVVPSTVRLLLTMWMQCNIAMKTRNIFHFLVFHQGQIALRTSRRSQNLFLTVLCWFPQVYCIICIFDSNLLDCYFVSHDAYRFCPFVLRQIGKKAQYRSTN